jgi:hypothetical protein
VQQLCLEVLATRQGACAPLFAFTGCISVRLQCTFAQAASQQCSLSACRNTQYMAGAASGACFRKAALAAELLNLADATARCRIILQHVCQWLMRLVPLKQPQYPKHPLASAGTLPGLQRSL